MGSGGHHGVGWDPFVEIPQLCDCPPATSRDGGLLDGAYSWREGAFSHHLSLADEAADGNVFFILWTSWEVLIRHFHRCLRRSLVGSGGTGHRFI
jgi:hypothetical protein